MSGIVALLVLRGRLWHWIITCISSCVGTASTISSDLMDANTKPGKLYVVNVHGITAWCGMPADVVNAKPALSPPRFTCPMMNINSFWLFLVQVMDASLGSSSRMNRSTLPNKPGRLSSLTPDVGRSRCLCALPNLKWLLNPPDYMLGKCVSNSS